MPTGPGTVPFSSWRSKASAPGLSEPVDEVAAAGEGLVGVGHVERRVTPCARPPSVIGGVGRHRRADAHAAGEPRDLLGPDLEAELGEDGVVRERGGVGQRGDAGVGVVVVVDHELLDAAALAAGDAELLLARAPDGVGLIAVLERLGEDERLERRAGLALALGGEVERAARCSRRAGRRSSPAPRSCGCRARRAPRPGGRRAGVGRATGRRRACAASWSSESIVVSTFRPPSNALPAPTLSTTCWRTQVVKYGYSDVTCGGLDVVARRERLVDADVVLLAG